MFDFDPRDSDSRDDDRFGHGRERGANSYDDHEDDLKLPVSRSRDRNDDARDLGRGPGDSKQSKTDEHGSDPREDARWPDRDRDARDRAADPRDVFTRDVNLPRRHERQIVHDARGREYTLRGSESRTLATVGAFRVVSSRDVRDHDGRPADARSGDLRHLREQGLVRTERLDGQRDAVVVLTKEGRSILESHRREHSPSRQDDRQGRQQAFYADLKKPREVEHDSQVFRAYLREAERLAERGARIDRVVLDYELKRDYQKWLHERDKNRDDADGRPDREPAEIAEWAREHELPYFDDQVHFPDLRIEYEQPDGRWDQVDVEVTTIHYRGGHAGAASQSGFSTYRGVSIRLGGGGGGGGGRGGGRSGTGLAERMLD
jgi:hypothetical protein